MVGVGFVGLVEEVGMGSFDGSGVKVQGMVAGCIVVENLCCGNVVVVQCMLGGNIVDGVVE
jgi:hypothetical protein